MARVLVVEDELIVARDLEQTLTRAGHTTIGSVDTGEAAVARAVELRPELVLMDMRLAGPMSGAEAGRRIAQLCDVPIVFLTAFSDARTLAQIKLASPYAYVVKPFQALELANAIEVALNRHAIDRRTRQNEHLLATTLDSIGDGIVAVDAAGRVTLINPVAERLTGWSEAEVIGRPVVDVLRFVDERSRAPLDSLVARVLRERTVVTIPQALLLRRDGSELPIGDSIAPIIDGEELVGAIVVFRDLTDRRRLESRLALSERLLSLGSLIGGLAHEINNPLAYVIAYHEISIAELDDLARYLAESGQAALTARLEAVRAALSDSLSGAQRVRRVVADLRTFAAPHDRPRTPVDLPRLCAAVVRLAEHEARMRASLEVELGPVPPVLGNEAQLAQALFNLVTAAAQAIPEGASGEHRMRVSLGTDAAGWAVLEIEHTGAAPAFDADGTAPIGAAGLSLPISRSIVTEHGGELEAVALPLRGGRYKVRLPAVPERPPRPRAAGSVSTAPVAPARRARVLVIDADEHVRAAIRRVLRDHEVTEAGDAAQARAVIESGQGFDAILCDLDGPCTTLHAWLLEARPELAARLIVMSAGGAPPGHPSVLIKPFDSETLERCVRAALSAARGETP
jgi:PAS domain S-box-containing protein